LAAFRHRDYRAFWLSQLVSLTGTWMQSLAQSWLVLSLTNSPVQLGLVNVCQFGPSLFLGLPGGVLADRLPKRNLLLVTQSTNGGLTAVLATLVVTGRLELWHIYATALAIGVVNAVDMPTRQSFVADLVGKRDLLNAVALNSALFNASRVVGPALAGVLLAQVGPALCFVLNAASYAPVLGALATMRTRGAPTGDATEATIVGRLRQGLAHVRATPAALLPILLVGVVGTFGMNFNVWVPLLARNDLTIGAEGFGLLMAALGVGSLCGALTLAFSGRAPHRRRMLAAAVALGACEVLLALVVLTRQPVPLVMLLIAGAGFGMSTTMALANTTVQTSTPDALRGRVMSIYMTVFAGSAPLGAWLAGVLSGTAGAPAAVAVGGTVVAVAAAGIALMSRLVGRTARPAHGADQPRGRATVPSPLAAPGPPAPRRRGDA
jgi:MFS family permease